jgi:hypothetical protein
MLGNVVRGGGGGKVPAAPAPRGRSSFRRPTFTLPAGSSNTSFENDENVDHWKLADTVLNVRECGRTDPLAGEENL